MSHCKVWIGLGLIVALFVATEALATTVLWAPVDELAASSSLVVQGTVDSKSVVITDQGMEVYTEYHFSVDTVLKGEHSHEVVIRIPGGESQDRTLEFHGAPVLEPGAEYVLMLEAVPSQAYGEPSGDFFIPIGLGQGVWRVVRREAGVEVVQQTGDITLVSKSGAPPTANTTMTMPDFVSLVSGVEP